jgi:P27 family predicted phage terminase small subunit
MAKPKLAVVDGGAAGRTPAPAHLGKDGREWWHRQVAELGELGVLGRVDLTLVEQAAEMYEGRRQAQRAVDEHGQLVKGRTGWKKNPAVSKQLEYAREYRLCVRELAKLKALASPHSDDDDPFDF